MFKRILIACTWISGILTAALSATYLLIPSDIAEALAITAGTFFYHFIMRMGVGTAFHAALHNRVDYTKAWFQPKPFEKRLYALLKVKRWKHHMPTYDPHTFDPKAHTLDELAQAMCQSELVHETIIVLSFLPLFASVLFGAFFVFLLTSLAAALFDLSFVILQRFNRPRIITLIERQNRTT